MSKVRLLHLIAPALFFAITNTYAQGCTNVDPSTGAVSGTPVSCSGTFSGRIGASSAPPYPTGFTSGAPTQNFISVTTDPNTTLNLNSTTFGTNTATILLNNGANISIGAGSTVSSPASGAGINNEAIFIGNSGTINIGDGATVINYATGGTGPPTVNAGNNTIEIGSNNVINVGTLAGSLAPGGSGALVYAAGASGSSEAINPLGSGNTITNYGTIKSKTGSAIWFQSTAVTPNVVNNYGSIISEQANQTVFGGNGSVNFSNYSGGNVIGNVAFANGTNTVSLFTGSYISGSINGGPSGQNTFNLFGTGTDTLDKAIINFKTLNKNDSGFWTLNTALPTTIALNVIGGTLQLQGDNTAYTGTAAISTGATMLGTAAAIVGSTGNGSLTNNGTISFTDSGVGSYSGIIAGSGNVAMNGSGALSLSNANTYSGGTSINSGTIGVSNNSALGTGLVAMATGSTLRANSSVGLSNDINLTGSSSMDSNGSNLTLLGVIGGVGALDILGTGVVTLSGANTYSGQTTISSGSTLALANTGSIASSGLVTNNGTFDLQQKTTNTTLGGNYVQSSTGTLKMGLTTANAEKLMITGTASLSGGLYVNAAPGHYNAGRYTLITTAIAGRSGTFTSFTTDFDAALSKYRLTYDASDVYLQLDSDFTEVDTTNTIKSVQINAAGLANIYNQQVAAYQAALTYDCRVYDKNNVCVSVGGRYAYAGPSPSANQQAGLVVVGYKPSQNFRIGAFADQSIGTSMPTGFSQSNNSPMWGLFAKWHMNPDETGLGIQASGVASSSTLNITRPQLANTEAGSGSTQFSGQGYQLTTNYQQPLTNSFSVVPYAGLRYTRVNTGAYTENSSANVTLPLSYSAMAQNTFSAIGGVGFRVGLTENLTGTTSIGIQQNLKYSMSNYQVTSTIVGLESFSVAMPGNVNSMATATVGLIYDINKRERLGINILWQQQPFIATNTTTALATYTIGF